jgi:hypothetical protein
VACRLTRLPAGRLLLVLLAAGGTLVSGWGCQTPAAVRHRGDDGAAAAIERTALVLPGLRFGAVEEYPGERIYDYMDGAAVPYVEHRVRHLAACDVYRGPSQARIELYEAAAAADATALYREFSAPPGRAELGAGEAGCYWLGCGPEGIFHRQRFFARVLAYAKEPAEALELIRQLAGGLDAELRRPVLSSSR